MRQIVMECETCGIRHRVAADCDRVWCGHCYRPIGLPKAARQESDDDAAELRD
jgi:RNase P subunit RPR2